MASLVMFHGTCVVHADRTLRRRLRQRFAECSGSQQILFVKRACRFEFEFSPLRRRLREGCPAPQAGKVEATEKGQTHHFRIVLVFSGMFCFRVGPGHSVDQNVRTLHVRAQLQKFEDALQNEKFLKP